MKLRNQNRQSFAVEPLEGRRMLAATAVKDESPPNYFANAQFSSFDSTGTIGTFVNVITYVTPPDSSVSVIDIQIFDFATNTALLEASGNSPGPALQVSDDLSHASAQFDVDAVDNLTLRSFTVHVDLAWEQLPIQDARPVKLAEVSVDRSNPDFTIITKLQAQLRYANAFGTVTIADEASGPLSGNLTPNTSDAAEFGIVRNQTTTIARLSPGSVSTPIAQPRIAAEIFEDRPISVLN